MLGEVAESSPAYARAEEVKIPLSPPHRGLLSRLSSVSREMMKGITMNTLGRMKYKMGRIDEVIYKEVKAQLAYQDPRVIALLKTGRGSPSPASTPTKRAGKQRTEVPSPPRRPPVRTRKVSMSFSRGRGVDSKSVSVNTSRENEDATRSKSLRALLLEEELSARENRRKPVEGLDYF